MAYTNVPIPQVSIGLVEHAPFRVTKEIANQWLPFQHGCWVLDYCAFKGLQIKVSAPGLEVAPFARAVGTWHLYSPSVTYAEFMELSELSTEKMWILFEATSPFPTLDRHFTSFSDPDLVLVKKVAAMRQLQTSGGIGNTVALHGMLLTVLGDLCNAMRSGEGTPGQPFVIADKPQRARAKQSLLERVDRIIDAKLRNPPSLSELADLMAMSQSSLSHRFKAETGMTIVERIRWLRVREARRLLSRSGESVKTVAHDLGFSSPFYFSKVFADVTGITPSEYQRQVGKPQL